MANLSNRDDLAGTPSKATTQAALVALYDFVASRFAKGTAGVAAATDAELISARESLGLGGFTGKSLLVNPKFNVNQRGYVSGTATTAANQYTLDMWRVVVSGQSLTFAASGNGNIITAPAGGVEQVIEGINVSGGSYVLSWKGTATATVNGTARAKGESFTLLANTNATIRLIGGTAEEVQLERGSIITAYEERDYGIDLFMCRRYARKFNSGVFGAAASAVGFVASIQLSPPMRATPTASVPNLPLTVTDFVSNYVQSSATVGAVVGQPDGVQVTFGNFSGLTPFRPHNISGSAFFILSCEP